ncbi:MAG: hypothetical protein Q8O87_00605 [bacterium]|nr:hypothetical protein [bacterium]
MTQNDGSVAGVKTNLFLSGLELVNARIEDVLLFRCASSVFVVRFQDGRELRIYLNGTSNGDGFVVELAPSEIAPKLNGHQEYFKEKDGCDLCPTMYGSIVSGVKLGVNSNGLALIELHCRDGRFLIVAVDKREADPGGDEFNHLILLADGVEIGSAM